ncbi:MAG: hypothetical protein Kow0032_15050 [Methyloligellaceae bacterium]
MGRFAFEQSAGRVPLAFELLFDFLEEQFILQRCPGFILNDELVNCPWRRVQPLDSAFKPLRKGEGDLGGRCDVTPRMYRE